MSSASSSRARANFFPRYRPRSAKGAPKYIVLREAFIAAIADGYWTAGDRLPTELELTEMTPYSLGTVQRAIQTLVAEGFVTRKQRSGTYVAPGHKRIGGPWLFRFVTADGREFLPMFTKVTERRTAVERGPWFEWLTGGAAAKPLLRIERQIRVDNELVAFNRVYLDPDAFPFIAAAPLAVLDGANIVQLIQEACRLPISKLAHLVRCDALPDFACRALRLRRGAAGMIVEIAASAGRTRPVSYQQIFVPPSAVRIYISDSPGDWHAAAPAGERQPEALRSVAVAA